MTNPLTSRGSVPTCRDAGSQFWSCRRRVGGATSRRTELDRLAQRAMAATGDASNTRERRPSDDLPPTRRFERIDASLRSSDANGTCGHFETRRLLTRRGDGRIDEYPCKQTPA